MFSECVRNVFGYAGIFSITHAQVTACCKENDSLYVIVNEGELDVEITANSSRLMLTDRLDIWEATGLTQAVAWYTADDKWIVFHA